MTITCDNLELATPSGATPPTMCNSGSTNYCSCCCSRRYCVGWIPVYT